MESEWAAVEELEDLEQISLLVVPAYLFVQHLMQLQLDLVLLDVRTLVQV